MIYKYNQDYTYTYIQSRQSNRRGENFSARNVFYMEYNGWYTQNKFSKTKRTF